MLNLNIIDIDKYIKKRGAKLSKKLKDDLRKKNPRIFGNMSDEQLDEEIKKAK